MHGPVIQSDVGAGIAFAKKRAWDGGELDTLLAWLRATWATDWESWRAEAEKSAINVNMYFADVEGNIGYFHGGQFPTRRAGHDNRLPANGDGSMDWGQRQPVETANPHVLNPSSGFVANWNNKPGDGVMNPDFFFYNWSSADRVDYLNDALAARDQWSPEDAWELLDSSSYADVFIPYFLPVIERAIGGQQDPALDDALQVLKTWNRESRDTDGDGYYDEAATALFRRFLENLVERVLADDLGDAYPFFSATGNPTASAPTGAGTNIGTGVKAIVEALNSDQRFDLFNGESADTVIVEVLQATLDNGGLEPLPVSPRPYSVRNFLGIPQAGEDEAMTAPVEQNRGTENNMIVMQPDAIVGWEVTPPGQSGFIAPDGNRSEHYADQFDMYYRFGRKRMWFYEGDVEANAVSETIITY